MVAHSVLWASPQPLWGRFRPESGPASFMTEDQSRPAILRFKTDDFMERVFAVLASDPRLLSDAIARPETWRNPGGELTDAAEPTPLPRLARALKRMRRSAATADPLDTATDLDRAASVNGVKRALPLKLYQPAHQRHYLVAAHLVCGVPGFPEKGIASGGREQIGFVLRRLVRVSDKKDAPEREYAFVKNGSGPHWQLVPPDEESADRFARTVDREEMLPLFPMNFHDDVGHPRRLLAGTIPVGRREEYIGSALNNGTAPAAGAPRLAMDPPDPAKTRKSARKEQFKMDVSEPWKALIRSLYKTADRINSPDDDTPTAARVKSAREANQGAQMASWLILLDFADYLAHHVKPVWDAVAGEGTPDFSNNPAHRNLFNWINTTAAALPNTARTGLSGADFKQTLRKALKAISADGVREGLEAAESTFVTSKIVWSKPGDPSWPQFYFLLAGVRANDFQFEGIQDSLTGATADEAESEDVDANPAEPDQDAMAAKVERTAAKVDKLVQLVLAAVDANAETVAPPVPFAAQVRDAMASVPEWDDGWFTLRCVYVRCDCGPLQPTVFSAPSQRFQLASFFDSDAPARPIRIALPIDTTAAGMRKYQKNTAFMLSDALCGQVNRMKGLGLIDLILHVLPWPFHKDLDLGKEGLGPCKNNFGMICSLSIPYITICALILLLMIALVLHFVFQWIPWFFICWRLPGFKAKKA